MTGFRVAIEGSDLAFDCRDDESLLDAAMRQGIEMSYSCRKGVCGNCRGQLLQGALIAGTGGGGPGTGIQAQDEHLFCRARPASDLVIRPRGWQRVDPSARKLLAAMEQPALVHGREMGVSASIGVALYPDDASDPETLVRYADTAMYAAKNLGRARHSFYRAEFNSQLLATQKLEQELRDALAKGDGAVLEKTFDVARTARRAWDGKNTK